MVEEFAFTPTVTENREAVQAVSRSISSQTIGSVRRTLTCLAMYGLPLLVAAVFFKDSLGQIYLTFLVFIGTIMLLSRFGSSTSVIAQRVVVPQKVRISRTGIAQEGGHAHVRWRWDSLNRLHVLPHVLVLEFRDWSYVPLPNRLWPNEEVRRRLVDDLRAKAPNVLPDLPSASVPSPFSLINVGSGFAAAELFLLQVFGATSTLLVPGRWPAALEYAQGNAPQAIGIMFVAALSVAVGGFFAIRYALGHLQRRHPRLATFVAATFIAIFAGLIVAALLYHPCGC